ncbi:phage tail sheath family protein [Pseudomaricurvus alcaniphilus]|uniref:phage tail sheath family protein n=1 Tax=Pseudomaricurvus alcaniphilus TaxID=1166482 RepID=UPI00140D910A|nr:phage tail sheath subtilisin-like domain-containing protein [Pseudomaricurvus alcaniphilus]NHN38320.1 phage tail sheath family protein [Pseudomaricurvus alcaniphilus]
MPEYLAPGVFVEEVSFRSKSIEGVATSTTGFAGMASWGPVCYRDVAIQGPINCEPRLITSFTEFERVYGGLNDLAVGAAAPGTPRIPYLAHAARAFFENGGKRLYVSRVFTPRVGTGAAAWGIASRSIVVSDISATWTARWPGAMGNMYVQTEVVRSKNLAYSHPTFGVQAQRARVGAVVEVIAGAATDSTISVPDGNDALVDTNLRVVQVDSEGRQSFVDSLGGTPAISTDDVIQLVEMRVRVSVGSERLEEYVDLAASDLQKRYIGRILQQDDPEDQDAPLYLDYDPTTSADPVPAFLPARLTIALQANSNGRLAGGHDGLLPSPTEFAGSASSPDDPLVKATGLEALGEIDDIAIVALPDSGDLGDTLVSRVAAQALVTHAENLRYRIAVVDCPIGSSLNEVRDFRGQFDSKYAATYYPWIKIFDPNERFSQGTPPRQIALPPSGFVAGIYARNDIERGVHKAPANEIVRGLTQFEVNINKARNEVINPEGINALRFFEGRGYRVWGARTMSSDPEWKYVNVRRLFNFIEHSIDKGTQWAVFEPNNQRLWDNIRRTIEDFLLVLWRDGALLGAKPDQAYFVRCDRSTMTQNDLDNGRLICLIGIAPVKPAEFVIFRIGQWTGDAKV